MKMKKRASAILAALSLMLVGISVMIPIEAKAAAIQGWCNYASLQGNGWISWYVPTIGPGGTKACQMAQGSVSRGVSAMQMGLRCNSISPGSVDGNWGPNTTSAVLTLQRAKGIAADGVYGPQTHNAIERWGSWITDGSDYKCWGDRPI